MSLGPCLKEYTVIIFVIKDIDTIYTHIVVIRFKKNFHLMYILIILSLCSSLNEFQSFDILRFDLKLRSGVGCMTRSYGDH